jgi:hypothetical protein
MFEKPTARQLNVPSNTEDRMDTTHQNIADPELGMLEDEFSETPPDLTTDEGRMVEYSHTGDPTYLTPELAKRIGVSYDVMKEVPGATDEDLATAYNTQTEQELKANELMDKFYTEYGLDHKSLTELRERDDEYLAYLERLFDVASMSVKSEHLITQDEDQRALQYAKELLFEHAVTTEEGVLDLFGTIRSQEVAGVRDVQVIEDIFDSIHDEFTNLSNERDLLTEEQLQRGEQLADALNQFSQLSNHVLEADHVHKDANYITSAYFYDFCLKQRFTEPKTLTHEELGLANEILGLERIADFNRDSIIPFEIETGRIAVFGHDKTTLHIADKEYSAVHMEQIEELRSQINYNVSGQYFARRVTADIPYDLQYERDMLLDTAAQLGKDDEEIVVDPEQLRDYLYLQQADMREILESDFSIPLKELSIKEQLYFLNYLKNTTVEHVRIIQSFTSLYGVDGMRTFLSLEHGDETLGDKIVAFGAGNKEADQIFRYYSTILDSSGQAESMLNSLLNKSDVSDEDKHAHISAVKEKIQGKADRMLKQAIEKGDVDNVLRDIQNSSLETAGVGAAYVELLRSGAIQNVSDIDRIKSNIYQGEAVLKDDELLSAMEEMYRQHYSAESAERNIEVLHQKLHEPNAEVHVLQIDNKILSTLLTVKQEASTYVGALNTTADPEMKSVPLGTHMIKDVVEALAADGETLEATANLKNAAAYINRYNFCATKVISDDPLFFALKRKDSQQKIAGELKKKDIFSKTPPDERIKIIETERDNPSLEQIPDGMVISRIELKQDKVYLVYEELDFG